MLEQMSEHNHEMIICDSEAVTVYLNDVSVGVSFEPRDYLVKNLAVSFRLNKLSSGPYTWIMKWILCLLFVSSSCAEFDTIRELVLEVTRSETAELRLRIEQLEYQLNETLTLIDER